MKLADFGLARIFGSPDRKYTNQVLLLVFIHAPQLRSISMPAWFKGRLVDCIAAHRFLQDGTGRRSCSLAAHCTDLQSTSGLQAAALEVSLLLPTFHQPLEPHSAPSEVEVCAELLLRKPWMPGSSDIEQLSLIFQSLGTPTEASWPGLSALPNYVEFQQTPPPPLKTIFPKVPLFTASFWRVHSQAQPS